MIRGKDPENSAEILHVSAVSAKMYREYHDPTVPLPRIGERGTIASARGITTRYAHSFSANDASQIPEDQHTGNEGMQIDTHFDEKRKILTSLVTTK